MNPTTPLSAHSAIPQGTPIGETNHRESCERSEEGVRDRMGRGGMGLPLALVPEDYLVRTRDERTRGARRGTRGERRGTRGARRGTRGVR